MIRYVLSLHIISDIYTASLVVVIHCCYGYKSHRTIILRHRHRVILNPFARQQYLEGIYAGSKKEKKNNASPTERNCPCWTGLEREKKTVRDGKFSVSHLLGRRWCYGWVQIVCVLEKTPVIFNSIITVVFLVLIGWWSICNKSRQ